MTREEKSGWVWFAWGCGGCLVVVGVVLVGFIVAAYRIKRSFEDQRAHPEERVARALEVLGAEELPQGYFAAVALSVPFVFDTVVLADRPPDESDDLPADTQRLFVYVETIRGNRAWRRYAEGDADPSEVLHDQGVTMRAREEIGRGELTLDRGLRVDYISQRGELTVQGHDFDGIATFLFLRCENDRRMRIGVWAGPDPGRGLPAPEADFAGTCADPAGIRGFLSGFDVCGS